MASSGFVGLCLFSVEYETANTIAPPRVDSSKGPPRKIGKSLYIFAFFRPTQKMARDGPKWGREDCFPTNPDLADILGRTDLDFENFYILDFLGSQIPRFPGSQISRFPENMSSFVGRPFFRKLCASKNGAERYRRNILGPNFPKHPLFQFKGPRFLEALNLWVRCRRRLFFSSRRRHTR